MVTRHTHTRFCEEQRKILEGAWMERTGYQVKGDGDMERSKDDGKSVMKKEWRSKAGGGKNILWLYLCVRERTQCVFGFVR